MKILIPYLCFGLFFFACTNDSTNVIEEENLPSRDVLLAYQDSIVAIQTKLVSKPNAFINRFYTEVKTLINSEDPSTHNIDFESLEQEAALVKKDIEISIAELNTMKDLIPQISYRTNVLKGNIASLNLFVTMEKWIKSYKADRTQDVQESLDVVIKAVEKTEEQKRVFRKCEDVLNDIIKRTTSD